MTGSEHYGAADEKLSRSSQNDQLTKHIQPSAGSQAAGADKPATRYLCTGVYIDRAFRQLVLSKVHNDAAHRTAPSYGFNLVAVTHKAWRAWVLETAQQACLTTVLVIALVLDARAVVVAACVIGIAYLAWTGLRAAPEMVALNDWLVKERRGAAIADSDGRRERFRLVVLCSAGCVGLAAIAIVVVGTGHTPLRQVTIAAVLLAALGGISMAVGAVRQVILNRIRGGGPLRPSALAGRLSVIDGQQACQYVVYARPSADNGGKQRLVSDWDYEPRPFVGSGRLVHAWLPPLNVQLIRPSDGSMSDREHRTPPFKTHELVRYLKDAVQPTGQDSHWRQGLQIADRLYVDEIDVTADRSFLRRQCSSEDIDKIIDDPHGRVRHYLEIQLSTSGELVTTAFVRASVRGRSLSLDFAVHALTRTPDEYHMLDTYRETGTKAVLRSALRGMYGIPGSVGGLWRFAEVPWVLARAVWARKDRTLTPGRRMIGTRLSIREEKAAAWEDSEADHSVIYGDAKIIEQRLLKATEDFLESRDVDVYVLKKLALNIISNGILNMGRLEVHQTAVGTNAQIIINENKAAGGTQTGQRDAP